MKRSQIQFRPAGLQAIRMNWNGSARLAQTGLQAGVRVLVNLVSLIQEDPHEVHRLGLDLPVVQPLK
jgi:hypothetical protein